MKYIKSFESKGIDLFKAIINDDEKLVKKLIRFNVDINIQDMEGRTPIFYAANHDFMSIVEILIKAGADWNIINNKGYDFTYLLSDKQLEIIKKKYPNEYSEYLLKKEATNKYNL